MHAVVDTVYLSFGSIEIHTGYDIGIGRLRQDDEQSADQDKIEKYSHMFA